MQSISRCNWVRSLHQCHHHFPPQHLQCGQYQRQLLYFFTTKSTSTSTSSSNVSGSTKTDGQDKHVSHIDDTNSTIDRGNMISNKDSTISSENMEKQLEYQRRQHNKTNTKYSEEQHIIQTTQKWIDTIVVKENLCPFVEPLLRQKQQQNKKHKEEEGTKSSKIGEQIFNKNIRYVVSKAIDIDTMVSEVANEAKFLLQGGATNSTKLRRPTRHKEWEEIDGLLVHDTPLTKENDNRRTSSDSDSDRDRNTESHAVQQHDHHQCTLIMINRPFVYDFHDFDHLSDKIYEHIMVSEPYKYYDILHTLYFHPEYFDYYEYRPEYLKFDDSFFYPKRSPYPTILLLPYKDIHHIYNTIPNIHSLTPTNKMNFVNHGLHKCQHRLLECYFHDDDDDDDDNNNIEPSNKNDNNCGDINSTK